jgi:hypothetical protein
MRRCCVSCWPKCSTCEGLQADALEIVGRGGAAALSMDALSERSGLSADEIGEHYRTAAACIYDVYDDASATLFAPLFGAFDDGVSWDAGFESFTERLLAQVTASPLRARLCFVEAPRVDRELRRRCERRRRELVDYLAEEYERRRRRERLSDVQIELLVGASFHVITQALAAEDPEQLRGLGAQVGDLAGIFEPAVA